MEGNKGKTKVAIIGAGVVGSAVGYILKNKGYKICGIKEQKIRVCKKGGFIYRRWRGIYDGICCKKRRYSRFITTPDKVIQEVCDKITDNGGFKKGAIVVHMSGLPQLY